MAILLPWASAQTVDLAETGFDDQSDFAAAFQDALSSGAPFSGQTDSPETVTLPHDTVAEVSGAVVLEENRVSADLIEMADTKLEGAEGFVATEDGFSVATVDRLEHRTTRLEGAERVTVSGSILTAGSANGVAGGDTRVTFVDDLRMDDVAIDVAAASLFNHGDITAFDLPASTITKVGDGVRLDPEETGVIRVRDGTGLTTIFEGNGSLIVGQGARPNHSISSGRLTVNRSDQSGVAEIVETNATAKIQSSKDGITKVRLSPASHFFLLHDNPRLDLALYVPGDAILGQTVCLLKRANDSVDGDCDSVADDRTGALNLHGHITYQRRHTDPGSPPSSAMRAVYEGVDPATLARIEMAPDRVQVTEAHVSNDHPAGRGILARIHLGPYMVYEHFSGTTVEQFARFLEDPAPDLIMGYRSDFLNGSIANPPVVRMGGELRQNWFADAGKVRRTTLHCADCHGWRDRQDATVATYQKVLESAYRCGARG